MASQRTTESTGSLRPTAASSSCYISVVEHTPSEVLVSGANEDLLLTAPCSRRSLSRGPHCVRATNRSSSRSRFSAIAHVRAAEKMGPPRTRFARSRAPIFRTRRSLCSLGMWKMGPPRSAFWILRLPFAVGSVRRTPSEARRFTRRERSERRDRFSQVFTRSGARSEPSAREDTRRSKKWKWDRRDSNSGPTHPMRRGYHYPTVPRFKTSPARQLRVSNGVRRIGDGRIRFTAHLTSDQP